MASTIRARAEVKTVFEVGMLTMKETRYMACSPDSMVFIDTSKFEEWKSMARISPDSKGPDQELSVSASLEIKTKLAGSTLGPTASCSTSDLIPCETGDAEFKNYIPSEEMGQLMLQSTAMKVDYCLYLAAGDTSVLYAVLIRIPPAVRHKL